MYQIFMSVVVAAGLLAATSVASAQTAAQVEAGQKVFTAQKCAVCHAVAGVGNKKGPLEGVAAKATAERKPAMKGFPNLPKDDLDALVAYIQSLKK